MYDELANRPRVNDGKGPLPRIETDVAKYEFKSQMMRRGIFTGKVDEGISMGDSVTSATAIATPFVFGKIIPSNKPNEFTLLVPLKTVSGETSAAKIGLINVQNELDPLLARQVGKMIADNPTATKAYSQMQKFGTEVKLDFGPPPERRLFGQFFPTRNKVEIYMQNNVTAEETIATMVHESSHGRSLQLKRPIGTQMDEFRAFIREELFKQGKRPSLDERRAIWEQIQIDYANQPTERNPFGGKKQ